MPSVPRTIYLDTGSLQALIESGTLDSFLANASRNGFVVVTTQTVVVEISRGSGRSQAVTDWLIDTRGVQVVSDPNGSWDLNSVIPDDAGERGLADLARQDIANGRPPPLIVTQDVRAFNGGLFEGLETRSIGQLVGRTSTSSGEIVPIGGGDVAADVYFGDPVAEALARDQLRDLRDQPGGSRAITPQTRLRTDADIGVSEYQRYTPDGAETRYSTEGAPPGDGWRTRADWMQTASSTVRDLASRYEARRSEIADAFRDPANYTPEGELSPTSIENIRSAYAGLRALGAVMLAYDAWNTGQSIGNALERGDRLGAATEFGAFLARWEGAIHGGIVGAEFGAALGGPWGALIGLIVGGIGGAALGDLGFRRAVDGIKRAGTWLPGLLGPGFRRRDPLVFDLGRDGIFLSTLSESSVHFDLNSDGTRERVGWLSPNDGLLTLDINGNGLVDDGSELFGTNTRNGFVVLSDYDLNLDGVIDSTDAVFSQLRIWRDINQDGISQLGELFTLGQVQIASINLTATPAWSWSENAGNSVLANGSYVDTTGNQHAVIAVALNTDQINTRIDLPAGVSYDPDVFKLPNLRGYGQLPDLWVAMTLDPALKQMVQDFVANLPANMSDFIGSTSLSITGFANNTYWTGHQMYEYTTSAFEEILERWAGVNTGVGKFSVVETLIRFMNQQFEPGAGLTTESAYWVTDGVWTPATYTNVVINSNLFPTYQKFVVELATRFLAQLAHIELNQPSYDLFAHLVAAGQSSATPLDAATIEQLVNQALANSQTTPQLSPLLQHYASLIYDFNADSVGGDIATFIDGEMQSLPFNASDPWAGYFNWRAAHLMFFEFLDPSGAILEDRFRAHTGNQALTILNLSHTDVIGDAGANTLLGDQQPFVADLFNGGAGNDNLQGGAGNDTYVFRDGFGNDVVLDASGTADEIAFQQSLTSDRVRFSFAGTSRTDIVISFTGASDTILVQGYFDAQGNPSIEKMTFPDGVSLPARAVRDAVMAGLATSGADTITAFAAGSAVYGGAGNDTLTGLQGDDEIHGGADNDTIDGGYGDDRISGDTGDDTLSDSDGSDTYVWRLGDGNDVIRSIYGIGLGWADGFNTIEFGPGIRPSDLRYSQFEGGTGLTISVAGQPGSISIGNQLLRAADQNIDQLRFADGTVLSREQFTAAAMAQFATAGNDTIYGSANNDTIDGGLGDDTINGRYGDDRIFGGAGDDTLLDSDGSDAYVWRLGDGNDVIRSVFDIGLGWADGFNTLEFGPGITPADLRYASFEGGTGLTISVAGQPGSISLGNQLLRAGDENIDQFRFADGTILSREQFTAAAMLQLPTGAADTIFGSAGDDTIEAGAGNDTVNGRGGNDRIAGGLGDDALWDSEGDDTYVWRLGDGNDIIRSSFGKFMGIYDGFNTIEFGQGIAATDLRYSFFEGGTGLTISVAGQAGSISIGNQLSDANDANIDQLRFADGSVLSRAQFMAAAISQSGTSGNDVISGGAGDDNILAGAGDDTIDGRQGNDRISGGTGNDAITDSQGDDTYYWNLGDGADVIRSAFGKFAGSSDGFNTIEFGPGISAADLRYAIFEGGSGLTISVVGQPGSISIGNQMSDATDANIDQLRFADGSVLTRAQFTAAAMQQMGTSANDTIYGSGGDDTINGGAGNDTINGQTGNDRIAGGTGSDALWDSRGDDTYVWNLGDGDDVIRNEFGKFMGSTDGFNTIEFGIGISAADLRYALFEGGSGLSISVAGQTGSISIGNQLSDATDANVDRLLFSDGSFLLRDQFMAAAMQQFGTAANDLIYGSGGDDTINGGADNDTINGQSGNDRITGGTGNDALWDSRGDDTYVWNLGDGDDVIRNEFGKFMGSTDGFNTIEFGLGIAAADLRYSLFENGTGLTISVFGHPGSISIGNQMSDATDANIDRLLFSDGSFLLRDQFMAAATVNYAPVQTAGSTISGAITELAATTGSSASDVVAGVIKFFDQNLSDTHTATISSVVTSGIVSGLPASAALLAWLSKGALTEQSGSTPGQVTWTFAAPDNSFDYLAAGQSVTLTYAIDISDGRGGLLTQNVVITVNGTNDLPLIAIGSTLTGAIAELTATSGSTLIDTASGVLKFTDADAANAHTGSVASVVASGVTTGLSSNASLLAMLTTGQISEQSGGTPGALGWTFSAQDSAFDYLGAGESVTLTYAVQVSDGSGGVLAQNVVITVTGSNDAPVLSSGSTVSGAVTELAATTGSAANDSVAGTIRFTDRDLSNVHALTVLSVAAAGVTTGLPTNAALLALVTAGSIIEPAGATAGSATWGFAAQDRTFDYLGAGQTVTLTYVLQLSDGQGSSFTQNVAVTVTGTNDAPVVSVPGAQTARTSIATRIAGVSVSDADANASETVTVTSLVGTVATTATGGATVTGSASKSMTISGTLAAINATLATLTYTAGASAGSDTITVVSNDGATSSSRTIAETVSTTANHGPVINAATTATGTINELAGVAGSTTNDTATGAIKFNDADVPDTHTLTVTSVAATGITSGLPANATLLAFLTKSAVTEPSGTNPGSVTWTFTAADKTFDYLGAGQVVTLTYVVTVTDSKSATATQNVVITVTGTNDAPLLAAGATTGTITELAGTLGSSTLDTATGLVKFTDESADTHTASITGVVASGTTVGLPATATMLAWLSKGALTEQVGATPGSLAWTFSAPDSAFDYLSAGQSATLTYTVQIVDNAGATLNQSVVVTINGANDAPTATAKSGFTTDNWTALTITGATLLAGTTDPDKGDTLTLSSVQGAVGGTVALTAGNAVFTPTTSAIGPASFTYTISDGHGATSTASVSVTTTLHQINGTTGNDTLAGNATKKAQIDGGAGNDTITAGGGGDTLIGGAGTDTLTGGAGIDTFVYHAGFGLDTINSFTATGTSHDLLQIDRTLFADWAHLLGATTQVGADLRITYDANNTITLKNVALANFTSADVAFV